MATNQNTGQNPTSGQNQSAGSTQTQRSGRELKDTLKEILNLQGDYRNILKDSIKELQSTLKIYDKMEAKLVSINRSALNIKEIEGQMKKIKEDNVTNDKKIADLANKLRDDQKNKAVDFNKAIEQQQKAQETLIKAQQTGNRGLIASAERNLLQKEQALKTIGDTLNVEQLSYAQALKTQELNKEILDRQQEQLKTEEKIRSNIGLTGAVLNGFANKLGIGSKYYEQMVEKARKLNEEGKKLTFADKLKGIGAAAGGAIKETIKDPFALAAAISATIPIIGGIIGGLKSVFDYIVGIQDKTVKFARAMNLSTGEARKLKMEFASLSISSGNLFITSQKMAESQMELTDTLGVTNVLSKEILATNIELKDIAGLDAQTRASIAESATITGKSAKETTKAVLNQVIGLKQATGISFQYQKILKEASNLSGVLGLQFAKYPDKLTKALVTTKAMGLELSKLDSMADSFLDFESSISKEFEAQLLTGKEINLAKAREAFLNNDLATAASEITRQVGTSGQFLKMNRIQQESIAAAMGMSRDDMANMLKQQELLSKLGAKDLKDAQAKVQALKAQGKTREEIVAITGEEAYQSLINASAQEKIAAFIDKIKQSIADFVESSGIIDKVEGMIEWLSNPENIRTTIIMVRDVFATIVGIVADIASGIITVLDVVGALSDQKAASAKAFLSGAESNIRSLGGDLSGIGVGNNAAASAAGGGSTTTAGNSLNSTGMERDLNIQIINQVTDTATNMQGRINRGVYFESTTVQN